MTHTDTIAAIATPPGQGAIGIVRLSGTDAITIAAALFKGKDLAAQASHTLHYGRIMDGPVVVDEVVAALYKNPRSYTGEDVVEFSCHGSGYVLQRVLQLCLQQGARLARAGEYTLRAYLNGKLDLAQAEAVADLIASEGKAAHRAAMHNLRGGFSHDLAAMREQLITFSALIELELDFSEEDVEFADRTRFYQLIAGLTAATQALTDSFRLGNVIKNGVSVAIVGKPNAGKSTLLNALLNEERAIVSEIAGTTRDTIEETLNIEGILFRLIDTAGIRADTTDTIELQGIERSRSAMTKADVVIYLLDADTIKAETGTPTEVSEILQQAEGQQAQYLLVANKADTITTGQQVALQQALGPEGLLISARDSSNIHLLKDALYELVAGGAVDNEATIVTNARHYGALHEVLGALHDIKAGLDNNLPGDLLSLDIRRCLHYLGEITGVITTEDKLDYIFSKFCIGK